MKIRKYESDDLLAVRSIWQRAFAGFPWYENLSHEEMVIRWQACCDRPGFKCLVMEHDGRVVGFISWDTPTLENLAKERGPELAAFAAKFGSPIVWLEVICADPDCQRQGIARKLRERVTYLFKEEFIFLTRHRDDNIPIINLSISMGFLRVGIRMPSSQVTGLHHEYWYWDPPCEDDCF